MSGVVRFFGEALELVAPSIAVAEMEKMTGRKMPEADAFSGFVAQTRRIAQEHHVAEQRVFSAKMMRRIIPEPVTWMARWMLQGFAAYLPDVYRWMVKHGAGSVGSAGFFWLVGESRLLTDEEEEAALVDIPGPRPQAGVLLIERCKYLEATGGCKGLCLNQCKAGTEAYFTEELGLPVYMQPDLEKRSCHMMLLKEPLDPAEDPVLRQRCHNEECDQLYRSPTTGLADFDGEAVESPVVTPVEIKEEVPLAVS